MQNQSQDMALHRSAGVAASGLRCVRALGLLFALLQVGAVRADDEEVLQIKQAFDPKSISVAAGAAVRFVNGDDVKHNLQSVAPDGTRTDYGVAPPGQVTPITFAAAGEYTVVCGIHPRMKLKVSVHP